MTRLPFAWHALSSQATSSIEQSPEGQRIPALVQARNLTKRYQNLTTVKGISFDILQGECFGLLGPNGAGKTSTIKMINCTSLVTDGELWVDGKDVRRRQRAIKAILGVVSQSDSLDPDLNVIQNLLACGRFFNLPSKTAAQRAWETLAFSSFGTRPTRGLTSFPEA
jgi:lipooligosaccharide transport system ATP-binding protein